MNRMILFLLLSAMFLGCSRRPESPEPNISGITEYKLESNPQEISPKMYNWEVLLTKEDSKNRSYEIIQTIRPMEESLTENRATTNILIDKKMIVPNQEGNIHFKLYIGDREPTQNMNGPGNIGHPIIFSGRGTGKGASSWIVLPGSKVGQVTPSDKGTPLSEGKLNLIQFVVSNANGEEFQADVILRRK